MIGKAQMPVVSVHVFAVHASESSQVLCVVQVPELAHEPHPGADASSQRTPVRGDHALVLALVEQYWQGFVGSTPKAA